MAFKKYTKEQAKKAKEDKAEKLSIFTEDRLTQILNSFEQLPENKPAWLSPVFFSRAINISSNVVYSQSNTVHLAHQIFARAVNDDRPKNQYSGLPFFMTYKQAEKEGLQIEKGSKSYQILKSFGQLVSFDKREEETGTGKITYREYQFYRASQTISPVFMLSDFSGELSDRLKRNMRINTEKPTEEHIGTLVSALEASSPVRVLRTGSFTSKSGSFYSPSHDVVNIPPSPFFKSPVNEMSTLAHEIAHSWGHEDRFNRDSLRDYGKDDRIRAEEELVANVAAQAVLNHFNVVMTTEESQESFSANHDVYDFGWASHLKTDREAVERAMFNADKTAAKIIHALELELVNQYLTNPDLPVSEFTKERILAKQSQVESENKEDNVIEEDNKQTKKPKF
ncbi:zincin-like metallopeptidase domain-containing protein [Leclercia adecarboxylata]|uniref:zincin-like metallopeptidase domain-containing protein n=1 Tax=Leclercia adecarboxylata TaxID=83655 RepID=UPI003015993D